jgi:spore coat protein U-like protein
MGPLGFLLITALLWLMPLQALAAGGDSMVVDVAAVVLSKNQCKFKTAATSLDFGQLDPSNPVVRNASTTIDFSCKGSAGVASFLMTDDGGLNSYHLVHQTDATQTIPYALTLTPASGTIPKNVNQTLTISGSIQGADYQTVLIGLYADTVIVTLQP